MMEESKKSFEPRNRLNNLPRSIKHLMNSYNQLTKLLVTNPNDITVMALPEMYQVLTAPTECMFKIGAEIINLSKDTYKITRLWKAELTRKD